MASTRAGVSTQQQPVFALMRTDLRDHLRAALQRGERTMAQWAAQWPIAHVIFDDASAFANVNTSGGRIEVLPGNHVLVPERQHNRVVEYDAQGRAIWELPFREPIAAVRLPNGHTLVTSYIQNRAVELDRDGREVWEYRRDTKVTRAFRR